MRDNAHIPTGKQLSWETGADVENTPYYRGYWAYWADRDCPSEPPDAVDGWIDAQKEHLHEKERTP